MKKRKFFTRMFLTYVLITFLYTSIVAVLFYYKNDEIIDIELENRNKLILENNRENIETKLKSIFNIAQGMTLNEHIRDYAISQEKDYYGITKIFNNLQSYSHGFSDLGFTMAITRLDDLVISSNYTRDVNRYFQEININDDDLKRVTDFFHNPSFDETTIFVKGDENTISIFEKKRLSNNGRILFIFTFNKEEFLPKLDNYNDSAFMIIKDGEVISLKSGLDKEYLDNMITQYQLKNKNGIPKSQNGQVEGYEGNHKLSSLNSKLFRGLSYVYISPHDSIENKINSLFINALGLYILLSLLGVVLAFFIAQKTYKPIGNIVNIFKGFNDGNDIDEISFIEETATEIRKANKDLNEIILNNQLNLKTKFLRELLNGLYSKETIDKKIKDFSLNWMYEEHTVVVLQYTNYDEIAENYDKDGRNQIKNQVQIIVKEQIKNHTIFEMFELNYMRYAIILKNNDKDTIKKLFNSILSDVNSNSKLNLVAVIGSTVNSIYSIEESYLTILSILDSRSTLDKRLALTQDDINTIKNMNDYYYPIDLENDIINNAVRGNEDKVKALLSRIIKENLKIRNLNKRQISQFLLAMNFTISRVMQKLNINSEEAYEENLQITINNSILNNDEELTNEIYGLFNKIIGKVMEENEQNDNSIADEMLNFVHQNFDKDISLEDIAEHFNLSAGYISIIFKDYIKDNFKNYLNRYRIEFAKKILKENSDIKIKELANMVGCNNSNTFIRMFKRYEGVSPGQYIKN